MTTHLDPFRILRRLHITEKGAVLQDLRNQYVFLVHPKANKIQIRDAVQRLFKVKVTAVNTIHTKGKQRRVGLKIGRTKDFKKAVVTLQPGQVIEVPAGS